ncbi:hypothetical protein DI291_17380 [Bacillus paralicheniformis]|nr:hypothetical protein DI291_17380 [Bacillus paralicheniformis]
MHRIHVNLFADMRINIGCYLNTFVAEALLNTAGEISTALFRILRMKKRTSFSLEIYERAMLYFKGKKA